MPISVFADFDRPDRCATDLEPGQIKALRAYGFIKEIPVIAFRGLRSLRDHCDSFRIAQNKLPRGVGLPNGHAEASFSQTAITAISAR